MTSMTLADERRLAIQQALLKQPGLSFRSLSRATDIPPSSLRHHVDVLLDDRRIWSMRVDQRLAHFAGKRPKRPSLHDWQAAACWDNVDVAMCRVLRGQEQPCQADVIASFPEVPRSSIQYRLNRLTRLGVLQSSLMGRRRVYQLAQTINEAGS